MPIQNYQQPLDITVNHGEKVFFAVTGTHTIYLTGNYIMDDDDEESDEDDDEYDLSPDELEYAMGEDDESDELDDVDNPRIAEIDTDEEEAPKLVAAGGKKGKNKRSAEEAESLDDMIAAADTKLSKKQQKKLKNNKGEAVAAEEAKKEGKSDKKVQFAKELEQGPTGSAEKAKKATGGVKVVQGVTIDDRTIGKGRTVKNGDTVGVRYIGKLQNGKQFDGESAMMAGGGGEWHNPLTVFSQPTRRASPSPSRPAKARLSRAGTSASSAWPSAASVA